MQVAVDHVVAVAAVHAEAPDVAQHRVLSDAVLRPDVVVPRSVNVAKRTLHKLR